MPLYSFENTETGEEVDIMVSLADYDDFMANNPHLIRTYTKMNLVRDSFGRTGNHSSKIPL